ncbi:hypothetical protein [Archangium lansingense]|uniref:ABC transporter permease n=1 Tax=Archangium lansingense TaxID=2995310 RepID=A0ABT4AF59_9BACT|nr:hypothetical protein [Archangium lansinium]MCY1080326.1 hypothetical protein [Archangium lansinium]
MNRALLLKEWREHRGAWLLLNILLGLLLFMLFLAEKVTPEKGSLFELLQTPALILSSVGALFAGHRLVVREYGQRTQLFLEALPLSRTRILATKLVLGTAVLLLPLAATLLLLWSMVSAHQDVTGRFLLILSLRAATPVLLGWSFFALAGLLGRYRNPLYLFLAIAAFAADQLTEFDLSKAGPFSLLGADFAFERHRIPWGDLIGCWALTGVAVMLCFGLILYRDGTLAELFSQRMSHREKVFIACVFVGLTMVISMMDKAKQRDPFALHDAEQTRVKESAVQVASGVGFPRERAQALAERLAEELLAMSEYLGLERIPAVAVLPIRELDADVFQRAKLEKADGVVVRANLAAPDFDSRAFEAFLFREVLIQVSEGVVLREERQWLLDGFTTWWAHRSKQEERLSARAAVASRDDFNFRGWLALRERLGPCLSGALAARGVQALNTRLGEPSFRTLMQRTLAQPPGTGLWGLWNEPRLASLLREQNGFSEEELLRLWSEALREDRERHAKELERLAGMEPSLTLVPESAETFRLEHSLQAKEATALPARYALLHHKLKPFENEVAPHELSRQDTAPSANGARLPLGLARGDRWLFVVQMDSEALGCPIRLLAERREIR